MSISRNARTKCWLLSQEDFDCIFKSANLKFRSSHNERIVKIELISAFSIYANHQRWRRYTSTPSNLGKDLAKISKLSDQLSVLLTDRRLAADMMVRATHPENDVPNIIGGPVAPPIYTRMAIEIHHAAELARSATTKAPYISSERADTARTSTYGRATQNLE